jgi:phthiocerol/phenolphthiocerol synthesis type-I polyketide synthase C
VSGYDSAVAIVGMSGRFPGARNLREFWSNLRSGLESITPLSDEDLMAAGIDRRLANDPNYVKAGRLLDDVDQFDAAFFGFTRREAELLDPQHRLFLECAWEALEDAGFNAQTFEGQAGVYAGSSVSTYMPASDHAAHAADAVDSLGVLLGNDKDYLATQLSYRLNLTGPSIAVQTACSTSLVAVSMAALALVNFQCDLALAGGVTARLPQTTGYLYQEGGLFSPDGRCRPYSAQAAGVVFGSGVGAVVLKRMEDALAAGDRIYAVIRGWAVNNDGAAKVGFTAPGCDGQVRAISLAQALAGVEAEDIEYIEGHGTATPVGDAIEIEALKSVFSGVKQAGSCALGSVKANVGHLDAAAGVASLIKTALALYEECLPPIPEFGDPSPTIAGSPFFVLAEAMPWPRNAKPRLAGVSSFGIGGTNAHVILEEAPAGGAASREPGAGPLSLTFSARHPEALRELARQWIRVLRKSDRTALRDLCYTAAVRRTPHAHRLAIAGDDPGEMAGMLEAYLRGEEREGIACGIRPADRRRKLALVFGGQGGQWFGMGTELYRGEAVFRRALEDCARALRPHMQGELVSELMGATESPRFQEIDFVQPAIFAMQVALARLWQSRGVQPDAVAGQSMGEVAAAHVAGALSLEDAARVIARRSFLARRLAGSGAMAVVELSLEEARNALRGYEDRLAIAVSSSPRSTVLSGDAAALAQLLERIESAGVFSKRVKVDIPSHSPQVDVLRDDLLRELAPVRPRSASVPIYSTVSGEPVDGAEFDAEYWVRNFREPVLLAGAVERMLREGFDTFLEIGPHPVILPAIEQSIQHSGSDAAALASTRREASERTAMLESLGALYCRGFEIDWRKQYPEGGQHVAIPSYPWQRERFWIERVSARAPERYPAHPILNRESESSLHPHERIWETDSEAAGLAYVREHRVDGAALLPATAYLEAALRAAERLLGSREVVVEDVSLEAALALDPAVPARIQFAVTREGPSSAAFEVSSRAQSDGENRWTRHAHGKIRVHRKNGRKPIPIGVIRKRCAEAVSSDEHYRATAAMRIEYGPAFRGVQSVARRNGEALASVRTSARGEDHAHPAVLDAFLQTLVHAVPMEYSSGPIVPAGWERAWIRELPPGDWFAHGELRDATGNEIRGDIRMADARGDVFGEILGVRCRVTAARSLTEKLDDRLFELRWVETPRAAAPAAPGPGAAWVLIPDHGGVADALARGLNDRGQKVIFDRTVPCRGVVYCASLDVLDPPEATTAPAGLLQLVQALARAGWRDAPRLFVLTRGARAVAQREGVAVLAQSTVWGLARTIALEHPELACCTIDLDPCCPAEERAQLANELLHADSEPAVALRGTQRYVERLERRQTKMPRPLGAGEVRVRVKAVGVNFVDVLKSLGAYPNPGPPGGECAGVVIGAGDAVREFRPGDEVIAVSEGCFENVVTAAAQHVWHKPPAWSFEEAATVPVAFATAWYALRHLARLTAGERVLIHSAAGGVGLAAVQIAQRAGAEVYATVGTPEKRAYLESLGIRHIFDSRTLEFADAVIEATGGRGVDVVLNSLSGEAITHSLATLAPFGRFVEIGKRDIYDDRHIGLFSFRRNRSYYALDLAAVAAERPELFRRVVEEVMEAIQAGNLRILPRRVFPMAQAAEALDELARGKQIGKLVLAAAAEMDMSAEPITDPRMRADATYLITGGLGGIGLAMVPWMIRQGARNLVLVGRRESTPEANFVLQNACSLGARVGAMRGDVANSQDVRRLLDKIGSAWPPLRGIIHAAGVLDDGILLRLDAERLRAVIEPKAVGAWNLHRLTENLPLDFFVLFSSTSSVLGSAGQGNHAAANAFLDALAHLRLAQGRPALSINWGPWSEVGRAAGSADGGAIASEAGFDLLGRLLSSQGQVSVIPFDLRQWRDAHLAGSGWKLMEHLIAGDGEAGKRPDTAILAALRTAPAGGRRALLENHVAEQLAAVLRLTPNQVDRGTRASAQGLDSLMGLALRNRLERSLGLRLKATLIWNYPTVTALAGYLAEALGLAEPASEIEHLSEEEAGALLVEELARVRVSGHIS